MARPTKKGLDYFPLDVDAADDPVISMACKRFGSDAWAVFTETLAIAYDKEGYFAYFNEPFLFRIGDKFRIREKKIADIIDFFCQNKLLTMIRQGSASVITSAGIQQRYLSAVRRLRRTEPFFPDPALWLLGEIPAEGFDFHAPSKVSARENPSKDEFPREKNERKNENKNEKEEHGRGGSFEKPRALSRPLAGCKLCKGEGWIALKIGGNVVTKPCSCRHEIIEEEGHG